MRVKTTCFGRLEEREVAESQLVAFPDGLIGFEDHDRFAVFREESLSPFVLLQSVSDPWLAFVTVDLDLTHPGYKLRLPPADYEQLCTGQGRLLTLAIVTLHERPEDASLNLLAPLVINPERSIGRQVLQNESHYGVAEPLVAVGKQAVGATGNG